MISPLHRQCALELQPILQQQLEHISQYLDYLDSIKQAITQSDSDTLDQLLEDNPKALSLIEKNRQQQSALLLKYHYESTDEGLQRCLQALQNPALSKLKSSLDEHLKQLEKSLLINDLLIRKNQHRVRQSIQILTGHGVSHPSATYSRQGNSEQSEKDKRSLALA